MNKKIAVLLSGRGSNFEALAESVAAGRIPGAEIAVVISNREGAPGTARATERGIPAKVIPSKGLEREAYDRQVAAVLGEYKVDLVCLAGYMRLLSPFFVAAYRGRILNIHPSLLPAFPGLETQRQALEYGVRLSGCTVHFVDENLDAGPVILQAAVPVLDDDTSETLAERILKEEHRIYTDAVRLVLEGRYRMEGRRVIHLPQAAHKVEVAKEIEKAKVVETTNEAEKSGSQLSAANLGRRSGTGSGTKK
jgi:phosphoribosylglycinamide formyltransferase-1